MTCGSFSRNGRRGTERTGLPGVHEDGELYADLEDGWKTRKTIGGVFFLSTIDRINATELREGNEVCVDPAHCNLSIERDRRQSSGPASTESL
jgi:hypothetical protein